MQFLNKTIRITYVQEESRTVYKSIFKSLSFGSDSSGDSNKSSSCFRNDAVHISSARCWPPSSVTEASNEVRLEIRHPLDDHIWIRRTRPNIIWQTSSFIISHDNRTVVVRYLNVCVSGKIRYLRTWKNLPKNSFWSDSFVFIWRFQVLRERVRLSQAPEWQCALNSPEQWRQ